MSTFSAGSVVSRTFTGIGRSFTSVGVIVIGVQVVAAAMQFAVVRPMMADAIAGTGNPMAMFSSPGYWVGNAVMLLLFGILMGASIHGYLVAADDRRPELGECLRVGISKALPLLGLTVLWSLGVWVGMIFLFVPGLILMTMWSVCLPIIVAGDETVFGSFGRSRALTKGARWKIFGLLLVVIIIYYLLAFGLMGSLFAPQGANAVPAAMMASTLPAVMAGSLIITTIMMFVLPALLASIYVEVSKDQFGAGSGSLNEVFA